MSIETFQRGEVLREQTRVRRLVAVTNEYVTGAEVRIPQLARMLDEGLRRLEAILGI